MIATDKGWNLYVSGNGGAKPRHGDLLASDIDNETCIKYLDRFLMYYIETAGPLTRTSTWMDNIEGGIEHVKDVVINDSLGKAEEWEKAMQNIVDTFKCEWKDVIENPEKRKRFNTFVNSDEHDENIQFDTSRDQVVPQTIW
jgi:nitrite reductase (NADH) large subunit